MWTQPKDARIQPTFLDATASSLLVFLFFFLRSFGHNKFIIRICRKERTASRRCEDRLVCGMCVITSSLHCFPGSNEASWKACEYTAKKKQVYFVARNAQPPSCQESPREEREEEVRWKKVWRILGGDFCRKWEKKSQSVFLLSFQFLILDVYFDSLDFAVGENTTRTPCQVYICFVGRSNLARLDSVPVGRWNLTQFMSYIYVKL